MRPISISYTPLDDSTTFWAAAITGAGPFTPTTTSTTDSLAHKVSITSAANVSASTFSLTGTDADGKAQTESVVGPNITTVFSTKYFKTLTAVSVNVSLGANTADLGIKDESVSQTLPVDWRHEFFQLSFIVDISGTINYSVQHFMDEVYDSNNTTVKPAQGTWLTHSTVTGKTADQDGSYTAPIRAVRLLINSLTVGATAKFILIQAGNSG